MRETKVPITLLFAGLFSSLLCTHFAYAIDNKQEEYSNKRYRKKISSWIKKRNNAVKRWREKKASLKKEIRCVPDRVRMQKRQRRIYEWTEIKKELAKKWESKTAEFLKGIGKDSFTSER